MSEQEIIPAVLKIGEKWVTFKLTEQDIALPFAQFVERFLEPAFMAIKGARG